MKCLSVCKSAIGRYTMCAAVMAGMSMATTAMADTPVYDHMTGQLTANWGFSANTNAANPAGSATRQMGTPITLSDPALREITGFDLTWGNTTPAAITLDTTHRLRLNYWLWNTAAPTAGAGTLEFSALAGSGQMVFAPAAPLAIAVNQFLTFTTTAAAAGTLGNPGTLPGIAITPHVTLTNSGPVGVAFNWEIDNGTGTFAQVNGSTFLLVFGGPVPALGVNECVQRSVPNLGYFRSVNWVATDNNGNFDGGSYRSLGTNSGVAFRVYAAGAAVNVCCNLSTGACSATASTSCAAGSTFIAATTCTPSPCPAPNACCSIASGACVALLSGSCATGFTQAAGVSCTPSPCIPLPNDVCAGAITLPLSGTVIAATSLTSTADPIGGCAFDLVDGGAVWFKFTGTGNNVTVTTCDPFTSFDTVLHVYCAGSACTGPFNCVGGNDDANPVCGSLATASTVTVPTISGNQYYAVVNGFQGIRGNFGISATDIGTVSTNLATCASRLRCVVDTDPFDFAETDTCGAGAGLDTNNTCATATVYPTLGQTVKGFLSTTGNTRDIDIFQLPASTAGQSVAVAVRSEGPVLVLMQNDASGNCSTPFTVVAASAFVLAACLDINTPVIDVPIPATGRTYFLITTPSFDGNPCGSGENSMNDYRLRLSITQLGACCIPASNCTQLSLNDCATAGGLTWFGGLACSLGTGNVDPCFVTVGTCCSSAGVCSVVPNATTPQGTDCTTAGGTFTANPNATCTPNPCAPAGVCCRGSTCSGTVTTAAACTGSLISGQTAGAAFITTSSTCAAGVISSAPCCLADYNKVGGITVTDIFNFLTDWFGGSPYANTGGTGAAGPLAVQNIFDFLTNWFNGGC